MSEDEFDRRLANEIAQWLRLSNRDARLETAPSAAGQPTFRLVPSSAGAAAVAFCVGDSPSELNVHVGEWAWWSGVAWDSGTVARVCDAVARGDFIEEYKLVFGTPLARRGALTISVDETWTWGLITNAVVIWPGLKWSRQAYSPWQIRACSGEAVGAEGER